MRLMKNDLIYFIRFDGQLPCDAMAPRLAAKWSLSHINRQNDEWAVQQLTLIIEIERAEELFF